MIRNQWYAILESKNVKKGRITGVKRLGENLALWRTADNAIACIANKCVHRGASLSAGKIINDKLQCPFHGLQYDSRGNVVLIPANGKTQPIADYYKVASYATTEAHDFIWIFWGDKIQDLPELPFFKDIDQTFSYISTVSPWPMHYTRCIENQLDVAHLPFVHSNTIGSGNDTVVNGPIIKTGANELLVWPYNEKEKSQIPIGPDELPVPDENRFHLHFKFPNLWQNWISKNLRVFISFVPVDEEHTILYLRSYQNFIRVPVLKQLFNFILRIFDNIILKQDRRVVITQIPKKSELKMGEKLIKADGPIIKYREIRDNLKSL
jgi:phenylpropionate dioxygenase-like ring-hydroxylating dioxygenase large terminal subunit